MSSVVELLLDDGPIKPLTLRCPGWPVDLCLRCSDTEVLRVLSAHLSTALIDCPPRPSSLRMTIQLDDSLLRQLVGLLRSGPTSTVAGFLGVDWAMGEVGGVRIWLSPDQQHAAVELASSEWALVTGEPADRAALAALRICRELIRTRLAMLGGIALHASLVRTLRHGGVMIVGDPGAGKTTLALRLAQLGGYVVSTDQTYLLIRDGEHWGTAVPNAHRVAEGTACLLGVSLAEFEHRLIRRNSRTPSAYADGVEPDKAWLTAAELHCFYGILSAPAAPVNRIVIAEQGRPSAIRQVPTAEVPDRVREHLREPDPLYPQYWLAPQMVTPLPQVEAFLDRIANEIRVERLVWDPRRDDIAQVLMGLRL